MPYTRYKVHDAILYGGLYIDKFSETEKNHAIVETLRYKVQTWLQGLKGSIFKREKEVMTYYE